jgi:hypothetical protein
LRAHRAVWETAFITEMREWLPGVGGRDDGLDAVAACLLAEPIRLSRSTVAPTTRPDWRPGGGGWTAKTDFAL